MKARLYIISILFYLCAFMKSEYLLASHAQGSDITYTCLGNNQYQITVAFYRDCAGANAPNSINLNVNSASCNQNFNITLNKVPGTGIEISQICNSLTTTCNGGNYPGVQEYKYTGVVTLPMFCNDWTFSYTLCCRNNAINTIQNPGGQSIYVSAMVNNLNFPCNNSPQFSNPPLSYPCVGQTTCFNHGANDPDNDSLVYSLVAPQTGPNTTVTYINPYTAQQPLPSNPPVTINPVTGDICMSPTMQIVTVVAVRVEEWKDGILKGRVQRDIQIRSVNCNNTNPTLLGINGAGKFTDTICAGILNTFQIPSFDPDANQIVTMTWNNGITGATFTVNNNPNPTGTFSWTPSYNQISNQPYCFTVTVKDNACPFNGTQTFSFCLYVKGFQVQTTTTPANCGASNGTATAIVTGGSAPFTYQWSNQGSNSGPTAYGLQAGTYTVTVTDASGCSYTQQATVNQGASPGNINIISTNVSCHGGSNGSAFAQVNGGQPPYTYLWSTGATSAGINGLPAGTYWVTVTTNQGCTKSDTVVITQPDPLIANANTTAALCYGSNTGWAQIAVSGGTPPYQYALGTDNYSGNNQFNNLSAGNYTYSVKDANGCIITQSFSITQPSDISANVFTSDVNCFSGNDGSATISTSGGTPPYTYQWNTTPPQSGNNIGNLQAGNYSVTVHDNNGCQKTFNFTINQPSALSVNLDSMQHVKCFGGNDGWIATHASGGVGPYQYQWNTSPVQNSNFASSLNAGSYIITITDANNCSVSDTITITEPSPLNGQISQISNASCFGYSNGAALVNATGGTPPYSYLWNTNPIQNTNQLQNVPAGNYTVTITDSNHCTTQLQVSIQHPDPLQIYAYPYNDTICPGQNITLSANGTGGTMPYNILWSNGYAGNSLNISPLQSTQFFATITDANGCAGDTAYYKIFVNDIQNVGIDITGKNEICLNDSVILTAVLHNSVGNYWYAWQSDNGNFTGNPIVIYPGNSQWIYLLLTDQCSNQKKDSIYIKVNPLPEINIASQSKEACGDITFMLKNISPWPNLGKVEWYVSNQLYSTDTLDYFTVTQSGMYTVWCYVTDNKGCRNNDSAQFWALVRPNPVVDFVYYPNEISIFDPKVEFLSTIEHADHLLWDFGDGNTLTNIENPVHVYENKGVYNVTLYAKNNYGCTSFLTKPLEILPEFTLYIPNAFTPDNDGRNDIFFAKGEEIEEFHMYIFNRWGELIFESNSISNGWDGFVNGEPAPTGVYTYKIWVKDFKYHYHEYIGSVNLIR